MRFDPRRVVSVLLFIASALFLPQQALAQSNNDGSVYGDAAAGTDIKLNSLETGFARSAKASSNGTFKFAQVPPGKYRITHTDASGKTHTQDIAVSVGEGVFVTFVAEGATQLDTIIATGANVSPLDLQQTESVTIISADQIEKMPITRDVQAVALLAPGTIQGDDRFLSQSGKPLISFGGSSPGENTFYLNGMNITDFRNFLGGAVVPFEFFREFQIRTGGYSAEFGRSLGGVVNAVTKRGTNDFSLGANVYYEPDGLRTYNSDVHLPSGAFRIDNRADKVDDFQTNIEAGGPLWANHLYGYAFLNFRQVKTEGAAGTTRFGSLEESDPFYGAKLDFEMVPGHSLEYTGFSSENETDVEVFFYDSNLGSHPGALNTVATRKEGGQTHILRYLGSLTDTLSLSVMFGNHQRTEASDSKSAKTGSSCPVIVDRRDGANRPLGCWDASSPTGQISNTEDTRDSFRADLAWVLGAHTVKLGMDYENNTSDTKVQYEGGTAYRYEGNSPNYTARVRFYNVNGEFEEKLTAFYIEDAWQMTDRLNVSLGIRNETLENFNKKGEEFLDFDTQITPRFGASYDLTGEGKHKVFTNLGRYTMPIATNTNIRFAGGEYFTEQYFVLLGTNADDTPILGAPTGPVTTYSDGSVPDPKASVDANIDPMYQDEFMVGFESAATDKTVVGMKYIYRKLVRAVEDSSFTDSNNVFSYFLFNPGSDLTLYSDTNGDGVAEELHYTAAQLGHPSAKRKYHAVEFTLDHTFSRDLTAGGSYTWSHSYGNFEGTFQSDIGQDDAGITIAFDEIGLSDYADGNLPNDRRHKLKLYGTFVPAQDWTIGANFSAFSGRPKNKLGNCIAGRPGYAGDCFYFDGQPSPRGSQGETDWIFNLDLGLRYNPSMFSNRLTAGVDVFNVFNWEEATRINELGEDGVSSAPADNGADRSDYGLPAAFQNARKTRLTIEYKFF